MNVVVVGLNHRTAPVAMREQFALSEEALGQALYQIKQDPVIGETLVLATCNRVEIYAVVTNTEKGCQAISEFFLNRKTSLEREDLAAALYAFVAKDCVRHLFRVASSLDSMVIGEPQILGQVKDAFENALQHKATGTILNKVFKKAISVAKRIRTETKIAESAVSVSFAAVQLAKKIFGRLDQKSVMLVGAGEMAELAARHFLANGAQTLLIANRNYEHSLELASEYKGIPVKFEDFIAEMYQSDIVLCATGAPHYVIGPEAVSKVIAARRNRPIFFIDISVPRNIDPAINQLDNVFLYDMDDLKLATESNLRMREAEALKAEEIIAQETEQIIQWYKSLDAVPLILAVKERAEAIRQAEANRVLDKLSLTPAQQKAVEKLTSSIVNKLLHFPLTTLKEEACSTNGSMILESARRLLLAHAMGSETTAPVGHGKTLDAVTQPADDVVPEETNPSERRPTPPTGGSETTKHVVFGNTTGVGASTATSGSRGLGVAAPLASPPLVGVVIRVGSRGSPLALAQAEWVVQQLTSAGHTVTLKKITTQGDKILDVPLAKVGGKGLFVKEIEEALLSGEIDLAVHSMKDMPAQSLEGLTIGAVPKREDPRDALISQGGLPLSQIASEGKIGTSSLRRQAHFKKIRPDLVFIPLRGNLHTRLRKLAEGEIDAVILAAAGLHRLGLKDRITEYIPFSISLPAVGQGALAIECRADDKRIKETIAFLNDSDTALETCAERAMLARLAGGCQVPIAGWAKRTGSLLQLEGLVSNLEGTIVIRETKTAPVEEAYRLGVAVAESLLAQGADQILDALMAQGE